MNRIWIWRGIAGGIAGGGMSLLLHSSDLPALVSGLIVATGVGLSAEVVNRVAARTHAKD